MLPSLAIFTMFPHFYPFSPFLVILVKLFCSILNVKEKDGSTQYTIDGSIDSLTLWWSPGAEALMVDP